MPRKKKGIWLVGPKGLYCCKGNPHKCYYLSLLQGEETDFHDSRLRTATDKINKILMELRSGRRLVVSSRS